jgi:hypothetical protein
MLMDFSSDMKYKWIVSILILLILVTLALLISEEKTLCGIGCLQPSEYTTIDEGPFTFKVLGNWHKDEIQGIDSLVGRYTQNGKSIFFDYGWYSNSLDNLKDNDLYNEESIMIDGHEAKLVTSWDRIYVTAVHIKDGDNGLTFVVNSGESFEREIIESIRFS